MPDIEALQLTLKRVEQSWDAERMGVQPPDDMFWRQTEWFDSIVEYTAPSLCGTSGCFAGHALVAVGGCHVDAGGIYHPDGRLVENIAEEAQELLGLSDHQAAWLFAANNSLGRLRQVVEEFSQPDTV